jgi:4-hydroxybenzoyl-CoA thioesterase
MSMFANSRVVRIKWSDCDPAGIIYYPNYFVIFDDCTGTLFERALGLKKIEYTKLFDFVGYPLVDSAVNFRKPTRYGDDVTVESAISFGTSSFEVKHRITLNGELMADAQEKRVWVVRDPSKPGGIKSSPIPQAVLDKFKAD